MTDRVLIQSLVITLLQGFLYSQTEYDYYVGSFKFSCIEGWSQMGKWCFTIARLNLPFEGSNDVCNSPAYNNSGGITVHNWFLMRDISTGLLSSNGSYWTGFYYNEVSSGFSNSNVLNSSDSSFSISIYNPLWAQYEPPPSGNATKNCVSFNANFSDDLIYGWHASDCSQRLPIICQTFACLQGELRCDDNSRCYPETAKCDQIQDCPDASDEAHCSNLVCNFIITDQDHGYITLPSDYVDGEKCEWVIQQGAGSQIILKMISNDIGERDLLIIDGVRDPISLRPTRIAISHLSEGDQWISVGSSVAISFQSKLSSRNLRSFQFQFYSQVASSCGQKFENMRGSWAIPAMKSPKTTYGPNMTCHWNVSNGLQEIISIQITRFALAPGDILVVYDGSIKDENMLGMFSAGNKPAASFVSSSSELNFLFRSQPNSPGGLGFEIHYRTGCLNEYVLGSSGRVESPGSKLPSKRHPFHCSWIIQVPCNKGDACPFTLHFDAQNFTDEDNIFIESGSVRLPVTPRSLPLGRFRSHSSSIMLDVAAKSESAALVATFSKDCSPLVLTNNLSASYSRRYEYQSIVEFSCDHGLKIVGSVVIYCKEGGSWSASTPVCVEPFCRLPIIKNGYVLNVTGYTVNSELIYSCRLGYNGGGRSICNKDNEWDPPLLCEEIDCGDPDPLYQRAALKSQTRNNSLYSIATYTCPPKMVLAGNEPPLRICGNNGAWTNPDFKCEAQKCYAISFPYGHFQKEVYEENSTARIICDKGFQCLGEPTCKQSEWSFTPNCSARDYCEEEPGRCGNGTCIPLTGGYTCNCSSGFQLTLNGTQCEDIDECNTEGYSLCDQNCTNTDGSYFCSCDSDHWLYDGTDYEASNITAYTRYLISGRSCVAKRCARPELPHSSLAINPECLNGLYLSNTTISSISETWICMQDGQWWNSKHPRNFCEKPITHSPGMAVSLHRAVYQANESVSFTCSGGYRLIGPPSATCLSNGDWSSLWPECQVQQCPKLNFDQSLLITSNVIGGNVDLPSNKYYLMCNPGYCADGGGTAFTLECNQNYTWTGRIPHCTRMQCELDVPEELLPRMSKLSVGESVSFSCREKGYALKGQATVSCVLDDQSANIPHMQCISAISSETYVSVGASAALWCVIKERCSNYTVVWKRVRPSNSRVQTIAASPLKFGMFLESAQIPDQDSYQCVVFEGEKVIDRKVAELYVHYTETKVTSWDRIVREAHPKKDNLLQGLTESREWYFTSSWQRSLGVWRVLSTEDRNWLITPLVNLPSKWVTIVVRYFLNQCASCFLKLSYYATDKANDQPINTKKFYMAAHLFANSTIFEMRVNIQKRFLSIALESDGAVGTVQSVEILTIQCPSIRIGLTEYSGGTAREEPFKMTGKCVNNSSPFDEILPEIICTPSGKWTAQNSLLSTCLCDKMNIEYHGSCVPRGPICYDCSDSPYCDDTSAVHCEAEQICFTTTSLCNDGRKSVKKGCSESCTASFSDITSCVAGRENCTLCCREDYCNWMPKLTAKPHLIGAIPHCMDEVEMALECPKEIAVIQYTSSFSAPVTVPFPIVNDNSPYYTISCSVDDIDAAPYPFNSSIKTVYWQVTDNHGRSKNCSTQIARIDPRPPVLNCPDHYTDFVANTTSSTVASRLPLVNWSDASNVHLVYHPKNGTKVEINQPLKVTVTAIDEAGNMARCHFWYTAKISDCPRWQVSEEDFICNGTYQQRSCVWRSKCEGREEPPGVLAVICVFGQGWRIVFTDSSTDHVALNPQMLRSPACIPQRSPYLQVRTEMKLTFRRAVCMPLVANQVQERFLAIKQSICPDVIWDSGRFYSNGSLLTVLFNCNDERRLYDAEKCAKQFSSAINTNRIFIRDACDGFRVDSQAANHVLKCAEGWVLNALNKCERCRAGYFATSNRCQPCPVGTYSEVYGSTRCEKCPSNKSTLSLASFKSSSCIEFCPPGSYSLTGLAPCKRCPIGSFEKQSGSKSCSKCGSSRSTSSEGSTSENDCVDICPPGSFSITGLQPCSACPQGYYQPNSARSTCHRCPHGTTTLFENSTSLAQCEATSCLHRGCLNGGSCDRGRCLCRTGYAGSRCGVPLNLCTASYCLNNSSCSFNGSATTCECSVGYMGERCDISTATAAPFLDRATPCKSNLNLCSNGLCVDTRIGYRCECFVGYKNPKYDEKICVSKDACDFAPCKHGICVNATANTFDCIDNQVAMQRNDCSKECGCKSNSSDVCGNFGLGCNCSDVSTVSVQATTASMYTTTTPINCPYAQCLNGATVIQNVDSAYGFHYYFCKCNNSFGESCGTTAPCSVEVDGRAPCIWGRCISNTSGNSFRCKCIQGFEGPSCSTEENHCVPNPCAHDQLCLSKHNGFSCYCSEEYSGAKCENLINPCDKLPCGNKGNCTPITYGYHGNYSCECEAGWTGKTCREMTNPCSASSCAAGSECCPLPDNRYACFCNLSQAGEYCDEKVAYCGLPNPCFNSGTCIDIPGGYYCICLPEYTGANCEDTLDPCLNEPCCNGGTCINSGEVYYCVCTPEYTGQNCSVPVDPCNDENYCLNGGTCIPQGTVARCECEVAYTGDRCEINKTLSFNLYFTGRDWPERVVSSTFSGDLLKEFSLCAWVKPVAAFAPSSVTEDLASPFIVMATSTLQEIGQEIVSISSSEVKIEGTVFGSFGLDEGEWHQLCLRANRNNTIDLLKDGSVLSSFSRMLPDLSESQILILLGQTVEGNHRFVGELSLVQLYRTALENEEIYNMTFDCQRWLNSAELNFAENLILGWNHFTSIDRHNSAVMMLYPGICVSASCLPGHAQCQWPAFDKIPPRVKNCPHDQYVVTSDRLTVVTWSPSAVDDIFSDNVFVTNVVSNYKSGDVFSWGEYHIMYIAYDEAGNIGICEFDLIVSPNNCSDPEQPRNGTANINSIVNRNARRVAFLECSYSYLFATKIPNFFVCDVMGRWSRWFRGLTYRFPACSAYKAPEQRLNGSVLMEGECTGVAIYVEELKKAIIEANEKFGEAGFCASPDCSDEVTITTPSCIQKWKRSDVPDAADTARTIQIDYVLVVNVTRKEVAPYVGTTVHKAFNNSQWPTTQWSCNDPDFPMFLRDVNSSCVKCTAGQYLRNSSCVPCPENTYKDADGNGPCKPCPDGLVTGTTGAFMLSDCYTNCEPGSYYVRSSSSCSLCPLGTYQPESGSIECIACDPGYSTSVIGAKNKTDCDIMCGGGEAMDKSGKCVECEPGTYRPNDPSTVSCVLCNLGFFSASKSSSPEECNIPNCPPGTYVNDQMPSTVNQVINKFSDVCLECAVGDYQDEYNRSRCARCPPGSTTLQTGATSMRYCVPSPATVRPSSTVSPQRNPESKSSWVTWLVVGITGCVAAVILASVIIIFRKRLRNLIYCCKSPDLKSIVTTDYYRDTAYTYPVVTSNSSSPSATIPQAKPNEAPQLQTTEIYNEIFTGLQRMANGSDDSRARDFEDVEPVRRSRLTVDTTMRVVEAYGPEAVGMDSSGFPVDSADYERAEYDKDFNARQEMRFGETFGTFVTRREREWDGGSTIRRRFDAISQPYCNDTEGSEWRRRISYYQEDFDDTGCRRSDEHEVQFDFEEDEDDDDEDYFG